MHLSGTETLEELLYQAIESDPNDDMVAPIHEMIHQFSDAQYPPCSIQHFTFARAGASKI